MAEVGAAAGAGAGLLDAADGEIDLVGRPACGRLALRRRDRDAPDFGAEARAREGVQLDVGRLAGLDQRYVGLVDLGGDHQGADLIDGRHGLPGADLRAGPQWRPARPAAAAAAAGETLEGLLRTLRQGSDARQARGAAGGGTAGGAAELHGSGQRRPQGERLLLLPGQIEGELRLAPLRRGGGADRVAQGIGFLVDRAGSLPRRRAGSRLSAGDPLGGLVDADLELRPLPLRQQRQGRAQGVEHCAAAAGDLLLDLVEGGQRSAGRQARDDPAQRRRGADGRLRLADRGVDLRGGELRQHLATPHRGAISDPQGRELGGAGAVRSATAAACTAPGALTRSTTVAGCTIAEAKRLSGPELHPASTSPSATASATGSAAARATILL